MHSRVASIFFVLIGLAGCAELAPIYSLSPAVKESADEYGQAMDDFTDRTLLANVLRARDNAPLNFSDLPSITGSFSVGGSLGLTIPFGYPLGAVKTGTPSYPYSATPMINGSSTPIITLGTLNTQGFMMTMLQPISTTYVLSKWNSYPHEFLLYLFIKAIRFPTRFDDPLGTSKSLYLNDPDDPIEFAKFRDLITAMVEKGHAEMRSLMILDPLGNPVPAGITLQSTTPIPSQTPFTAPPVPPTTTGSAAPDARTYYFQLTYVTKYGETLPSSEISADVALPLQVTLPSIPASAGGAPIPNGFNLYIGTAPGKEVRQNTKPLDPSTWTISRDCKPADGKCLLFQSKGATPPAPGTPIGTSYQVNTDYSIFQAINGMADGQLHAGNARCPQYVRTGAHSDPEDLCPRSSGTPFIRFYKEYPAQIVLCVRTEDGRFFGHFISSPSLSERERHALAQRRNEPLSKFETELDLQGILQGMQMNSLAAPGKGATVPSGAGAGAGAGAGGGGGGGGAGAGAGGGAGGAGAMPQVTLALQPNRISQIVNARTCNVDQIVLSSNTEEDFANETRGFTHVEWRSISEVIQYLGAVARFQGDKHPSNLLEWGPNHDRLFTYQPGGGGRIAVDYRGTRFSVPDQRSAVPDRARDHSLQALALLNELIGMAKIAGSLPVPQPVTVLP